MEWFPSHPSQRCSDTLSQDLRALAGQVLRTFAHLAQLHAWLLARSNMHLLMMYSSCYVLATYFYLSTRKLVALVKVVKFSRQDARWPGPKNRELQNFCHGVSRRRFHPSPRFGTCQQE